MVDDKRAIPSQLIFDFSSQHLPDQNTPVAKLKSNILTFALVSRQELRVAEDTAQGLDRAKLVEQVLQDARRLTW